MSLAIIKIVDFLWMDIDYFSIIGLLKLNSCILL